MASSIFQNLLFGLPALAAAITLIAAGLALIASGGRTRDELLARRVRMVQPGIVPFDLEDEARPGGETLLRLPTRGLSMPAQREVVRLFSKLGLRPVQALTVFTASRLVLVLFLGALTFLWVRQFAAFADAPLLPVLIAAMAGISGWFLPMIFISHGVKLRIKTVRSGLPDALELLVVCVEAGLSLEDGLDRVVNELKHSQPALADELNLTLADLKILPSRDQALANLAERVDVPSVRSVVTTLTQTLRYGTPLAQSLRVVAAELRNDYLIELEEKANRLPAYLTLPVILFLMPTIFLVVGGPAALRLIDAFAQR